MEELETRQSHLFARIKPLCNSLLHCGQQSLTRETAREASLLLKDIVHHLESTPDAESVINQGILDAILFPLLTLIKTHVQGQHLFDNVAEASLHCVLFLLTRTLWSTRFTPTLIQQLVTFFTLSIDRPSSVEEDTMRAMSEETKHLAVKCLAATLPAKYKQGRFQALDDPWHAPLLGSVTDRPYLLSLSHTITVLLKLAKLEYNLQLRLDALQTLSQLLLDNVRNVDIVASLLPGVISTLNRILSQKKEKENHQIIVATLDILGDCIQTVMRDDLNADFLPQIHSLADLSQSAVQAEAQQLAGDCQVAISASKETPTDPSAIFRRTQEWHDQFKQNLRKHLDQMLSLRHHSEWRTRLAFVQLAHKLLSSCARSIDNCVACLVETLVLYIDDEYPEVSEACQTYMEQSMADPTLRSTMIPVLKSELYRWMTSLPRSVITGDDTEKCHAMTLVAGYILFLDDHVASILESVLGRISEGWLSAFEMDTQGLYVLDEQRPAQYIELGDNPSLHRHITYPKFRLKHLLTDRSVERAIRMFNVIGRYDDTEQWITHFTQCMMTEADGQLGAKPQAGFIVHALLSGAASTHNEEMDDYMEIPETRDTYVVQHLALRSLHDMMDIIDPSLSHETLAGSRGTLVHTRERIQAIDEAMGNVMTICFALRIVGLAACLMDTAALQDELITLLYPLLVHLGSGNLFVRMYARITLDSIAMRCGQPNTKELAMQNIDYIINSVSQRIITLTANPKAPLVLKALIHVAGSETIVYLEDSVEEIFDALDRYHVDEWICNQLCGVLTEIVKTVEWTVPQIKASQSTPVVTENCDEHSVSQEIMDFVQARKQSFKGEDDEGLASMEEIGQYFLDQQKRQEPPAAEELQDMEQDSDRGTAPTKKKTKTEDEENKPLSQSEQMVLQIMEKAAHFLTAPSPQLRSQMLQVFSGGVTVLANRLDKLNPLLHTKWPLIVNRLDDPQTFVGFHAASLIQTMTEVSGDFLSGRIMDDIWPRFKTVLQQASTNHPNTVNYSVYSYLHRLQRSILLTLTHVAATVDLRGDVVRDMLEHTKYFLQANMHSNLQEAAVTLFTTMGKKYPDNVWITTFALLGKGARMVPGADLLPVFEVPRWLQTPTQTFKANAQLILATL
ncbi:armadillo-type protein [Radiomyces spectabilis]|uniref:armadillo-type protein n=1 Tax=Radiomyces spectabilis TaxID=64574 RepID=UPI00221E63BE|nr:armadillo-type protein [Radiomyces spectabilis]KAI8369462.1 armadillo-type protein [Radiomyces spectabilis]